jgi:hypothetical protein
MDERLRLILIVAGTIVCVYGAVMQNYALLRHRATDSVGPWMGWNPRNWRERREWFASDYGYRMYRWYGWCTLMGGMISTVGWIPWK